MERKDRKSINDYLNKYDYLAGDKDVIEVTQWANEEGIDVMIIKHSQTRTFSLSYGELDAISFLSKSLDYEKL